MRYLFVAICLYISAQDIRKEIISHRSLLILLPFCLFFFNPASIKLLMVALILLLLLAFTTDIGGGDIKLMAILITTQGAAWMRAANIPIVVIASSAIFLVLFIHRRALPERVPLAPVILAPLIAFYLAI